MKKLVGILRINLRHELLPNLCLALLVCCITPLIFGLNQLSDRMAAIPLETVVILTGPILLVPVFFPEQDSILADVMYTKQTPPFQIYLLRTVYTLVLICLIPLAFIAIMHKLESDVSALHYLGTFSSMVFLGGLGMFSYALSGNLAVAYMVPIVLYVLCFGAGNNLGCFDVLRMMHGVLDGKQPQLWCGLGLILLAILYRSARLPKLGSNG